MPYAYSVYAGNGSATQYTISFPYIRKEHVKVFVNYVDTTFTFANDSTAQLATAPANGLRVEVRRVTPADNVLVDYTDGSTLTAADLDTNALQQLYLDQELDDAQKQVVTISATTGLPTLSSQRLTEVADPTAAQDAATKNYVDTNFQPLDAELTELATMSSGTASALADLTQAETQILDGATVSTSELNTLDGITASTSELNKLDGVTASTAELNKLDGVTASTAELNIVDGVTATAAEINALDGITASTAELNKLDGVTASTAEINLLDGVTATTAELNFVDGVTSAIQNQINGKQPLDSELTELATMPATTASALADLTQAEVQVLDGATLSTTELNKLDGVTSTTAEINVLDGVTATTTELNVTDGLTASTAEINQLDGKTVSSTLTPANTNDIPTSSAVNTFVSGLLNALGGFVAIANEVSFPTTNPDPSDNAGTVVSIADAGGVVVDASGVSATGRTTGNVTVTINGFPSSLHSTTLGAGLGLQVQTTSTLNTYTYHKLIAKEADVKQLSDDINDFQARYRVSANAPTTDLDEGDLWYDTTANKMKVYDTATSAWKEVQSVGNFFINTLSSSSATGGGSATFNGSAYRFTLSNAGANAQQMLVSVNGVIQKPNSGTSQPSEGFAINNNDIIFAAAPASGASQFIVTIGSTVNIGQPSNNTVDTSELVDGAVTNAKVSSSAAIAGTKISPDFGSQNVLTTGNVGINRTSPAQNLDVASTSNIAYALDGWALAGKGDSSDILFGGILGSQFDTLKLYTSGSERLRIDSSGRLLLGTTTEGRANATDNLTIAGSGDSGITIRSGTTGDGAIDFSDGTSGSAEYRGQILYDHNTDAMRLMTAGSEKLRIDSSGNVGIGSGANIQLTASGRKTLALNGNSENVISFSHSDTLAAFFYTSSTEFRMQSEISVPLVFRPNNSEAMRLDTSGRLLVGTTTSNAAPLTVAGSVGFGDSRFRAVFGDGYLDADSTNTFGAGNSEVQIQAHQSNRPAFLSLGGPQSTNEGLGAINFFNSSNTDGKRSRVLILGAQEGSNSDQGGMLLFYTAGDGGSSPTERMRISSGGSLFINRTSAVAAEKFSVGNDGQVAYFRCTVNANHSNIQMSHSYATGGQTATQISIQNASLTEVGSIKSTASSTSFNTSSDYRLKENVVDIADGITRVKQLAPKRFNFIINADKTVDGFLAHEAQAVVPEAVTGEKDGEEMQGIDQSKFVPLLTAALQEAIAKIETLETQNASLEARLTILEGAS